MDSRKFVLKETAIVALGQAICVSAMFGVFALLGHFDRSTLLGGIAGGILAVLNFFFMAIGGQAMIQASYMIRLVVLFIVLFALVKSGFCNVITTVLPLAFTRPILTISEFFRKSGEVKS